MLYYVSSVRVCVLWCSANVVMWCVSDRVVSCGDEVKSAKIFVSWM